MLLVYKEIWGPIRLSSTHRSDRTCESHTFQSSAIIIPAGTTYTSCSVAVELLRLLVEGRALLHRDEALEAKKLPRLGHGHGPALDPGVGPLPVGTRLTAHDLPVLVLHQIALLQPARSLRLGATEHNHLRELSLRDHALLHRLHGLHRLRH